MQPEGIPEQNTAKNRNRGGFTLTELIAVLVVIVVLLALLLPRYVQYIEDARAEMILADARVTLVSAQSVALEYYANGESIYSELDPMGYRPEFLEDILTLAMLDEEENPNARILSLSYNERTWEVTGFAYTDGTYEGVYDGTKWSTRRYEPETVTSS